jgi:fucose permease
MRPRVRPPVLLSYATFVLIGIAAGGGGVLLLAQMNDYGVDRPEIGITFFTGTIGFVLAGLSTGALIHRFGFRIALAVGGGAYALATLYLATRPPFALFVTGFGITTSIPTVRTSSARAVPGVSSAPSRTCRGRATGSGAPAAGATPR